MVSYVMGEAICIGIAQKSVSEVLWSILTTVYSDCSIFKRIKKDKMNKKISIQSMF